MGRTTTLLLCCCAISVGTAAADDTPLLTQDFEDQVAGQSPRGWSKAWGNQAQDVLMISSEAAASGRNSMLLERSSDSGGAMWGLSHDVPPVASGKIRIEFKFRAVGAGDAAQWRLELRGHLENTERLLSISAQNLQLFAGGKKLGEYQSGRWYRLTLTMPIRPEDVKTAVVELSEASSGRLLGTIEPSYRFPRNRIGSIQIILGNQGEYQLFIDDLKATKAE